MCQRVVRASVAFSYKNVSICCFVLLGLQERSLYKVQTWWKRVSVVNRMKSQSDEDKFQLAEKCMCLYLCIRKYSYVLCDVVRYTYLHNLLDKDIFAVLLLYATTGDFKSSNSDVIEVQTFGFNSAGLTIKSLGITDICIHSLLFLGLTNKQFCGQTGPIPSLFHDKWSIYNVLV